MQVTFAKYGGWPVRMLVLENHDKSQLIGVVHGVCQVCFFVAVLAGDRGIDEWSSA